jgi:folate-binding protein YgfZ
MSSAAETVELDAQYRALREGAGIVDRSGRRKLLVRGGEAVDYLQGQLTNDIEGLTPGHGCYAALLDRKGHIQADMRVLHLSTGDIWLDMEAGAGDSALRHLSTYKVGRDVEVEDATEDWAITSLIGPAAADVADTGPISGEHAHRYMESQGVEILAVATELGVDLITRADQVDQLRPQLIDAGASEASETAAEIVRVESGRPRFGHEITDRVMPAEAGIVERAVDFNKGCYIGQEPVARLHYRGKANRGLRGLRLDAPASEGDPLHLGERRVGALGTVCLSPALGWIALAVMRREAEPGATVSVGSSGGATAEVVELPFR